MKRLSFAVLTCLLVGGIFVPGLSAAEPLRVFIRGGSANRGQEVHAHPRFLGEWTRLLTERGMKVDGGTELPTAEQLAKTDVLVMYAQDGGAFPADQRPGFEAFLKRGGGLVVLHTATVPTRSIPDGSEYWKSIIGGSWVHGKTKWLEGPLAFYFVDRTHPITADAGNFDVDDEIYYDMDMAPNARVLGAAYTPNTSSAKKQDQRGQPQQGKVTVYDIAPQMWVYENQLAGGKPYRAFASLLGHKNDTFNLPNYRAILLRAIAWAGQRANLDEFNVKADLATLRYPKGGAPSPNALPGTLNVHPEFKVSLVASEPLINKVMNIDWDAQGRLWVCETPEYPDGREVNPGEDYVQRWQKDDKLTDDGKKYNRPAYDRISILTDTNGDGVMDKKQVFADFAHGVPGGLELVTSFVLHRDGVIASAAPDILFLRDTNGDGVCDRTEKLYTNLGTRDTHAVINNLRWGFDGWVYATHGYSSTPNVTSGDGLKSFGGVGSGVVRFKPDGSAFEQFSSKGGNTWGLQISWDNEVFWTQPTSGDLLMQTVMSESQLTRSGVRGLTSFRVVSKSLDTFPLIPYDSLPYVQIDWVGKFTAAAGCVVYDGGTWPAKWNYSYFTTEPTINLVHHQFVKPDGVSFAAAREAGRETTEFIGGKNLWFRPIEVRVGPDGALYVVDFANQAVIHNDTRGPKHGPRNAAIRPDRDHYYGRIWRVDHKDAKKLAVPNLAKENFAGLCLQLQAPNQQVRMTALRLIAENTNSFQGSLSAIIFKSVVSPRETPQSKVAALWALARTGKLDDQTVAAAANDASEAVRKNAMMAAAEAKANARATAIKLAGDPNPQVRLEALKTLAALDVDASTAKALVAVYPTLDDVYLKAAFMVVANKAPADFLEAAFAANNSQSVAPLVAALTSTIAGGGNADEAAKLVISLADKPAAQDSLKSALLGSLSAAAGAAPNWSPALQSALQKLLTSPNASVAAAALPLTVRWDKSGALATDVKREVNELTARLADKSAGDDARAEIAITLLGVRASYPEVIDGVTKLLGADSSPALQRRLVDALGALPDDRIGAALATALPQLSGEAQSTALDQLLKRAPWSLALLDALDRGAVAPSLLGPANVHRLRIHPNPEVSKRANALMDKLRGPEAKEKEALIAKLAREVEKAGDAAKGKELFTVNCSSCHMIGNLGNLVGPNLTGMGAHGPAELLGQIIDPNKEVDIAYVAISIETKDGEIYDGIITRENQAVVELRNAAGAKEIAKADIKSRRNTGRSLMPEGFESLGAEALRDLLTFIRADSARFRALDLSRAFTASSREGLYATAKPEGGMLPLAKYGIVNAFGVPFSIVDPAKSPSGMNLIVLKGGPDNSHSKKAMPQRVEVPAGFEAKQLHVLGNVGGWAFPFGGGAGVPVLKITAHYAGGAKEELVFKNGEEFADYIREVEAPGSKLAKGIADGGRQVRFATRALKGSGVIEKFTFESFDNSVAPTTVAVTADLSAEPLPAGASTVTGGTPANTPAPKAATKNDGKKKAAKKKDAPVQVASAAPVAIPAVGPMTWGKGVKALLVGGGSSHDFHRFFNLADVATLKAAGVSVNYTENPEDTVRELKNVDVAVLSVNRAEWATPAVRQALFDFVNAGKGLVLVHAGIWYNFKDWPEYNLQIVGGGSRGHDKLGDFKVNVVKDHPITKGVTKSFPITDELYYMTPDPAGTPIEVLAETSNSIKFGHPHPSVFVVKHPKTRIAAIALGHDARAHDLPEYQKLLLNAVNWAAGK